MLRVVSRVYGQSSSLKWYRVEPQCFFTTSVARAGWSRDFGERQKQYAARRERYKNDAEYRTKARLQGTSARQAYRASESEEQRVRRLDRLRVQKWLTRRLGNGERLTWKTHVVEYTDVKTLHHCGTCDRTRNARLWWRRFQDGAFECFHCFSNDLSSIAPIGYEKSPYFESWTIESNQDPAARRLYLRSAP